MHVDLHQCIVLKAGSGELCPAACATAFPPSVHSQDCLLNTPEYGDQGRGGGVPRIAANNLYLIPSYRFSCHGNVTLWGACVERGGSNEKYTILFYVIRPLKLPNCYFQMGANKVVDAMPENSCVTLDVPLVDQISVQPGDIVGVLPMSDEHNDGIEVDANMIDVTAHYAPSDSLTAVGGTCPYNAGLGGNLSPVVMVGAPVITAVVGELHV